MVVMAATSHETGNGDIVATPGKRSSAGNGIGGVAIPAAKRQRSFPLAAVHTISQAQQHDSESSDDDDDQNDSELSAKSRSNSTAAQVLRIDHARRASSPGVLKSSLKISKPLASDAQIISALNSPTENDKRSMYTDYVRNALLDRQRGKDAGYNELVAQFNLPAGDEVRASAPLGLLQMLLHALTGVASKLDKKRHSTLVHAILILPWATMGGDPFARTWTRFICALCSARSEWIVEVLIRSVRGLSYRSDWRAIVSVPGGPSNSQPTRRIIYARIHTLLRSLLSLIPTLPAQLGLLIVRYFPHKEEGLREHVVYVQNLFAICEYAEELRMTVLECVIGRSLEIDVEVQIELDELEEAEADFDEGGGDLDEQRYSPTVVGAEVLDKPLNADSDSENDEEDDGDVGLDHLDSDEEDDDDILAQQGAQSERQRIVQVRRLADKLDAIMSLLFAHLEGSDLRLSQASKGLAGLSDALTPDRAIRLRNDQFGNLVRIFERTMLPTFKSRHVQFVMFWIASLERSFCDIFVGMLLSKAIYTASSGEDGGGGGDHDLSSQDADAEDPLQGTPTVMRIAASSYVASLVARAKYIDVQDARIVMLNLCAFLDAHLNAHPLLASASQPPTPVGETDVLNGPHAMFYAVAQACFYIFCFRWRDLRISDDDDDGDDGENEGAIDEDAMRNGGMVEWCDGMDAIKRAVLSNLNPLAYCSSTVVRQFAGVAQLTGFMYCWNVIERNSRSGRRMYQDGASTPTLARSRTNSISSLLSADGSQQQTSKDQRRTGASSTAQSPARVVSPSPGTPLHSSMNVARPEMDSFFPFDPYRLRGSTKWVEPIYREWSDVAPDGMVSDDEESEEEEEEDDLDEEEAGRSDTRVEQNGSLAVPVPMNSSSRSARNGLGVSANAAFKHRPTRPSKLSKAHGINSPGFGASVSTDESSSIAHSLDAMSISPRFV